MPTRLTSPRQCLECGRTKRIHAWGLCGACYSRDWARRNPEARKAIAKRKYAKNKTADNERSRAYYASNREILIAKQRRRDARHRTERAAYAQLYQRRNRERLRLYYRQYQPNWLKAHPTKQSEYSKAYRARYPEVTWKRKAEIESKRRAQKRGTEV